MRALVRLLCAVLVLGVLGVTSSAQAVGAAKKTRCDTYATHKMCVVLHRNSEGRVWATGYLDKRSGRSNERHLRVRLYTRACSATNKVERRTDFTLKRGDRTARVRTARIAWDRRLVYQATVVGTWYRVTDRFPGGYSSKNAHQKVIRGPLMSACS